MNGEAISEPISAVSCGRAGGNTFALFVKLKVVSCGWRIIWCEEMQNEIRVVAPS